MWSLADSNNGYIHRFDVYTGKGSRTEKDAGLGESIVLNLTSHLQEKNHHVYCDNFFSSPKLFDELLQRKLYACGTIRQNQKGFPEDLRGKGKNNEKRMGLVERLATYNNIWTYTNSITCIIGVTWQYAKVANL